MEDLINKILGNDFEIIRQVESGDSIFIFFHEKGHSNPFSDEMLNLVSGRGPLRINKKTKEYEFTNIYDFYSEYGDDKLFFPKQSNILIDWDIVISNIRNRKRINVDDFILLLEHNNLSLDSFDIYSKKPPEIYDIKIKNDKAIIFLVDFLNEVNANYTIKNNNHFVIKLDIEN